MDISTSLSPSEIIQVATDTYSVTKLGIKHFIIAELPLKTFSSTKLTVYACETTRTTSQYLFNIDLSKKIGISLIINCQ